MVVVILRRIAVCLCGNILAFGCSGGNDAGNGGATGPGPVASVAIGPRSFGLTAGDTLRFSAIAKDAAGVTVGATLAWGASGGAVNGAGLFTAGPSAGPAKVWVAAGAGISDTVSGTVSPAATPADTVLADNFESGTLAVFTDQGSAGNHTIVNDPSRAHTGNRFLQIAYPANATDGWLTTFFMPGYDTLWVGYWLLLENGWTGGTKLVSFYGSRIDNQWSATGTAGKCPTGTDFFITAFTADPTLNPGPLLFYAQYPGMPREPDGVSCYGKDAGATYTPPLNLTVGSWHYLEFAVILNTPGQSNGRQRFWVDGVLRGDWSGLTLRTTTDLRLNAFTITNSTFAVATARTMRVDDILVARQRPGGF